MVKNQRREGMTVGRNTIEGIDEICRKYSKDDKFEQGLQTQLDKGFAISKWRISEQQRKDIHSEFIRTLLPASIRPILKRTLSENGLIIEELASDHPVGKLLSPVKVCKVIRGADHPALPWACFLDVLEEMQRFLLSKRICEMGSEAKGLQSLLPPGARSSIWELISYQQPLLLFIWLHRQRQIAERWELELLTSSAKEAHLVSKHSLDDSYLFISIALANAELPEWPLCLRFSNEDVDIS
ncbi:hypothetical protein DH2020_002334 [Rehmannia glutinosa]|uniref:Uncharacterized protein n=1 Tax=Rehmannia glutinosa TaxID=99300 RepID=A0ABR0XTU4_REHGL